jgi:hypothetical protein
VFLIGFPLLLIPFTIFNIIVFMMPVDLKSTVGILPLMSGKTLTLTLGDTLVLLSIFLLLIEMVKAARPGAKFAMDHILSLILFGCAAAEMLLLQQEQFTSIPFLFLVAIMGVDAIAGIAITWRFRRYRKWATAEVDRAKQIERQAEIKMERLAERENEKQAAPVVVPAPAPVVQPASPQVAPAAAVSPLNPPPAANEQTTS